MATISKLVVGQTLYSVESTRMGNTTMSRKALYHVVVKEIDPAGNWILASWNGNPPRKFYEASVRKLKVKKPEPKNSVLGMPSY